MLTVSRPQCHIAIYADFTASVGEVFTPSAQTGGEGQRLPLVARLGLRSIEVARLQWGDVDWRAGELVLLARPRPDSS